MYAVLYNKIDFKIIVCMCVCVANVHMCRIREVKFRHAFQTSNPHRPTLVRRLFDDGVGSNQRF